MEEKIKHSIFISFFLILLLPMLQHKFSFVNARKLDGFFTQSSKGVLTPFTWWDGTYQEREMKYLNDHMGFREYLVRANNQVNYSLFKKFHGNWIVSDKNNYLMNTVHVNSYYGRDYLGYSTIKDKLCKLKAIQDTLEALGKTVVLIHSPNKAYFYANEIPDQFKGNVGPTNLEAHMRIGDSIGLHQINFNDWFVSIRATAQDSLFTKQGIHWSVYGSQLAADSLERYLEQKRGIKMPYPKWIKVVHTNKPLQTDDDLAKTLNLIWPVATETFSYPQVQYQVNTTTTKPKVIYIGDSFLRNWLADGLMDGTNADWQVWLHFDEILDHAHNKNKITAYNWIDALEHSDCLVIMYISFNLNDLGDGFIDSAYNHYFPNR